MKKHGKRMEVLGGCALFVVAMASDSGNLSVAATVLLGLLCISFMLVGEMFTHPRKKRARRPVPPVTAMPCGQGVISYRRAA